mgnify:FL=1
MTKQRKRSGSNSEDHGKEATTFKQRKRSSKKSFLDGLLPDNINLTINMNQEDKEIVLNKIDEMKDDIIYNWRIVQVLMALGIVLGFAGSYLV